jgi:hypothetical protein
MNLGGLFVLVIVIIGAIMGLFLIAAKTQTGVVDTYGVGGGNYSNESQAQVQNLTATGASVGAGALIFVVLIICAIIFVGFIAIARKPRW